MELRSSQARSVFKYLVLQEDTSHHEIQDYEWRGEVPFFHSALILRCAVMNTLQC